MIIMLTMKKNPSDSDENSPFANPRSSTKASTKRSILSPKASKRVVPSNGASSKTTKENLAVSSKLSNLTILEEEIQKEVKQDKRSHIDSTTATGSASSDGPRTSSTEENHNTDDTKVQKSRIFNSWSLLQKRFNRSNFSLSFTTGKFGPKGLFQDSRGTSKNPLNIFSRGSKNSSDKEEKTLNDEAIEVSAVDIRYARQWNRREGFALDPFQHPNCAESLRVLERFSAKKAGKLSPNDDEENFFNENGFENSLHKALSKNTGTTNLLENSSGESTNAEMVPEVPEDLISLASTAEFQPESEPGSEILEIGSLGDNHDMQNENNDQIEKTRSDKRTPLAVATRPESTNRTQHTVTPAASSSTATEKKKKEKNPNGKKKKQRNSAQEDSYLGMVTKMFYGEENAAKKNAEAKKITKKKTGLKSVETMVSKETSTSTSVFETPTKTRQNFIKTGSGKKSLRSKKIVTKPEEEPLNKEGQHNLVVPESFAHESSDLLLQEENPISSDENNNTKRVLHRRHVTVIEFINELPESNEMEVLDENKSSYNYGNYLLSAVDHMREAQEQKRLRLQKKKRRRTKDRVGKKIAGCGRFARK